MRILDSTRQTPRHNIAPVELPGVPQLTAIHPPKLRMPVMKLSPLAALTAALCVGTAPSHAALLAYEPFDYPADSQLQGAGGAELGFDPGSTWSIENNGPNTGTATTNADVLAGGMSFGELQVTGNKGRYATDNAGQETKAIMRPIDFSVTTGTVWVSYLYRANASNNNTGRGLGIFDNAGSRDFTALGKRNATTGAGVVGYGTAVGNSGAGLTIATPYLIIASFENVGAATGAATMWMVSESEFSVFDDDDVITLAELNSIDAGRIASVDNLSGTPAVNADGTLGIVTVDTTATSRHAWWFDELRVGTTLADVTPIPEPSAAVFLALGLLALTSRGRR